MTITKTRSGSAANTERHGIKRSLDEQFEKAILRLQRGQTNASLKSVTASFSKDLSERTATERSLMCILRAYSYYSERRFEEAYVQFKLSLRFRDLTGAADYQVCSTYYMLAELAARLKRYDESILYFDHCIKYTALRLGSEHHCLQLLLEAKTHALRQYERE